MGHVAGGIVQVLLMLLVLFEHGIGDKPLIVFVMLIHKMVSSCLFFLGTIVCAAHNFTCPF